MNQQLFLVESVEGYRDTFAYAGEKVAVADSKQMFVKLVSTSRPSVFMTLHPDHAARVFEGYDSYIKKYDGIPFSEVMRVSAEQQKTAPVASSPKPTTVRKARSEGPSKKEQAEAIFKEMAGQSRAAIIKRFIEELDMSNAGASTYYHNCKKASQGE